MTDEEIRCADMICEWMRQFRPDFRLYGYPIQLREQLGILHEVEARLSEGQWRHYCVLMFQACCVEARTMNLIEDELTKNRKPLLHASAAQKIRALAEVIRGGEKQS